MNRFLIANMMLSLCYISIFLYPQPGDKSKKYDIDALVQKLEAQQKEIGQSTKFIQKAENSELDVRAQDQVKTSNYIIGKNVGQEFTIELPENPSTGYQWYWLVRSPFKHMPIELVSSSSSTMNPNLAGSEGSVQFVFKAIKPGVATILFYCKRGWEKNSDIDMRRYEITIN